MNVLVDTNVIIDWLLVRPKNGKNAEKTMRYLMAKNAEGYVSSHSLTDLYFCMRKEFSKSERQKLLQFILSKFNVITEEKSDFEAVLSEDDLDDLEDGLQMQCAKKANLDYIITENTKDFSTSFVQVLSTSDFLALIVE